MEQIYMVEIMIDKISIFPKENENTAGKNLTFCIKFGPKTLFIGKEELLAKNATEQDDIIDIDKDGNRQYTRVIRVGVSYLFPSMPDLMLLELSRCPLEIEVWNDDDTENPIFVGLAKMQWDPEFYVMLQETAKPCAKIEPLTLRQEEILWAECCCKKCGDITFILRVTPLGHNIITEFQQPITKPESILFQTNKSPATFECKRIEGDNANFCMVGSLYETTTLENPDVTQKAGRKIEICTQLPNCGLTCTEGMERRCEHLDKMKHTKKLYPIDKITMGDVTGPCGNPNCTLAHKIRKYIRNLDIYRSAKDKHVQGTAKSEKGKKLCGLCVCKDDRVHRKICQSYKKEASIDNLSAVCDECHSLTPSNDICKRTTANMVYKIYNRFEMHSRYSKSATDYNVDMIDTIWPAERGKDKRKNCRNCASGISLSKSKSDATIQRRQSYHDLMSYTSSKTYGFMNNYQVNYASILYQLTLKDPDNVDSNVGLYGRKERVYQVYNFCTDIPEERDCRCNPPVPTAPCRTFNCDCIAEIGNKLSRKLHKPYCPMYKHKPACPINSVHVDVEVTSEDEEVEPLPYGLPPIKLGPCPILGKPCTYPDGFSRMYKVGAMANQPKSYSEAGKVCCSKEYERIKKAVKEYMRISKENDVRCKNKYIVDTETRCCDHEQRLFSLTGRECCGRHKLGLTDLYQEPNHPHSQGK